ncbi:MAG: uroporphyrinogen decarboxylase family protein [Dehalococcoidia bacterium]
MSGDRLEGLSPQEKRTARFEAWLEAGDVEFVSSQAKDEHRQRVQRLIDVIELRKPDRIPISLAVGFYPAKYAGITAQEAMYDYEKMAAAWQKFTFDFGLDYCPGTMGAGSGRTLELLDYRLFRWPGNGLPEDIPYQCVEAEYMKPDEYDELIADPSAFVMGKYLGRICGKLEAFRKIPSLFNSLEFPTFLGALNGLGNAEVQDALKALLEAGREAARWHGIAAAASKSMGAHGLPSIGGGFSKAPFDAIGDMLRGTVGLMNDMYRRPENVLEALERLTPTFIEMGKGVRFGGCPVVTLPLHKGADGFMSDAQFKKFYWPTLKAVILALIEEGLVPRLFAEGGYNSRLEVLKELPPGTTIWHFDQTDMAKAKEKLGDRMCLMGNLPAHVLISASPEEAIDYCKNLIDVAGKDGGYIFSTGAVMDNARPENLKTVIETVKTYGRY